MRHLVLISPFEVLVTATLATAAGYPFLASADEIVQQECGLTVPREAHTGCVVQPQAETNSRPEDLDGLTVETAVSPHVVCEDGAEFWFTIEEGAFSPTLSPDLARECSFSLVELDRLAHAPGGMILDFDREAENLVSRNRYKMARDLLLFAEGQSPLCYSSTSVCQDNPVKRALEEKAKAEAEEKARLEAAEAAECERKKVAAPASKATPTPTEKPPLDPEVTVRTIPDLANPIAQSIATATHSNCDEPGGRKLDLCIAFDVSSSMTNDVARVRQVRYRLQERIEACHNDSVRYFFLEYGQKTRGPFQPHWVSGVDLAEYLASYHTRSVGVEPKRNAISACGRKLLNEGRPGAKKEVLVLTDEGSDYVDTIPQYTREELIGLGIEVKTIDFRSYR